MTNTKNLIGFLKKLLKKRGITYATIAKQLRLSETSVKRMFSQYNFSLDRLDTICGALGMNFVDLIRVYEEDQEKISSLTEAQELDLVSDIKFLLIAVCVHHSWTLEDIIGYYDFTESECIAYLIKLDRLGLIELLPNNKIRRVVAQNFHWLPGGPIEQFFEKTIQGDFLSSNFSGKGEQRIYVSGSLSEKSVELLNKKIAAWVSEFRELQNDDEKLPVSAGRVTGCMLAVRSWEPKVFKHLKRIQS